MKAFAIATLSNLRFGAEIAEYLRLIDQTLRPFGGAFRVHGAPPQVLEGTWPQSTIVIEFPDMERAQAWYRSPGYQAILPLRTRNAEGNAILIEGVEDGYRAADSLAKAAQ